MLEAVEIVFYVEVVDDMRCVGGGEGLKTFLERDGYAPCVLVVIVMVEIMLCMLEAVEVVIHVVEVVGVSEFNLEFVSQRLQRL